MKGICQCCDCVYYNMKQHKCNRGCKAEPELSKGEDVRFFADCPLPEAEAVKHGNWKRGKCTNCEKRLEDLFEGKFYYDCEELHFCPNCGARMDGDKK